MHGRAHLELVERPHPYPSAPDSRGEIWGVIRCHYDDLGARRTLFITEWNLIEPVDWFASNHQALAQEQLDGIAGEGSTLDPGTGARESLADALQRLQRREFGNDDAELEWATRLFEYRQRHMLTFAMRGARIPQIVLGCNGDEGELSLARTWTYRFGMKAFLDDTLGSMRSLVTGWRDRHCDVASMDGILARLSQ